MTPALPLATSPHARTRADGAFPPPCVARMSRRRRLVTVIADLAPTIADVVAQSDAAHSTVLTFRC